MSNIGSLSITDEMVDNVGSNRKVGKIEIPFGTDETYDLGLASPEYIVVVNLSLADRDTLIGIFNTGGAINLTLDNEGINTNVNLVSLSRARILPNLWKCTVTMVKK